MNNIKNEKIEKVTPLMIFSKLSMAGIPISIFAYLNEKLQVILLSSLVVYYFTLLLIFSWILIKKPSNFYTPDDYKDEEKFLTALKLANQNKNKKGLL